MENALNTQNSKELLNALDRIVVEGGGDCAELALEGLLKGLNHALPKSVAFILTDASAKDHDKVDAVLKKIQELQVMVFVLSTGNCDGKDKFGFKVFEKIAQRSGGQVIDMKKGDISKVLEPLKDILNPTAIESPVIKHKPKEIATSAVTVDSTMSEICAIVSGEKPKLVAYDPSSKEVTLTMKISVEKLIMGCIKDPVTGKDFCFLKHPVNIFN